MINVVAFPASEILKTPALLRGNPAIVLWVTAEMPLADVVCRIPGLVQAMRDSGRILPERHAIACDAGRARDW